MFIFEKRTQLKLLVTAIVVMGSLNSVANAAIGLDRTRAVFPGTEKAISLNISNQNKQLPYLAQAWLEDDKGNKIQSPFSVLPPLQRVEPDKSSQVRIQSLPATAQLPQDRESIYYFNLREIPPRSSKPNTLQLALQTRIKMFYRPAGIIPDKSEAPWAEKLTLTKSGNKYLVSNPTPFYVTLVDGRTQKEAKSIDHFEPLMVAPRSSGEINVTAAELGANPVLTYINDYGGRPLLSFKCSGSSCVVVPEPKKS
jgi:P pilus assembly chaperone PapD